MQKFVDGYLEAVGGVYSEGEPSTRTVLRPTDDPLTATIAYVPCIATMETHVDDATYQKMTKHAQNLYQKHQAANRVIRSDSLKGELTGYMEWNTWHATTTVQQKRHVAGRAVDKFMMDNGINGRDRVPPDDLLGSDSLHDIYFIAEKWCVDTELHMLY
tara:strand:+ start:2619 stop:3095 length:477 start_codon:yes stop_codon:yes gene_type:complete